VRASLLAAVVAAAALTCACAHGVQPRDDSDAAIRARIETQIRGRRDIDLSGVTIDVYARVVTVSGIVPSPSQIRAITRLINRVPGVDQTINNLVLKE
jgi:osmotically-inducible protein OsmY